MNYISISLFSKCQSYFISCLTGNFSQLCKLCDIFPETSHLPKFFVGSTPLKTYADIIKCVKYIEMTNVFIFFERRYNPRWEVLPSTISVFLNPSLYPRTTFLGIPLFMFPNGFHTTILLVCLVGSILSDFMNPDILQNGQILFIKMFKSIVSLI